MSAIIRVKEDQPRPAVIDRIARAIAERQGVVILPTDTVYGFVGRAFDNDVFERLDLIKGERRMPYAAVFESLTALSNAAYPFTPRQRRMVTRLLPGPVTFIINTGNQIPDGFRCQSAGIGVRVPSDSLLPRVAKKVGAPMWATSANRSGELTPASFSELKPSLIRDVDLTIDAGPTQFRMASSVIDIRTYPYKIMRVGPWISRIKRIVGEAAEDVRILVICTGNICRSPLASAALQKCIGPPELTGITVDSAGLDAAPGTPATEPMVEIAAGMDVDLSRHRSKRATVELMHSADLILTMTGEHLSGVLKLGEALADRTRLFGERAGLGEIPDPFDGSRAAYRNVAQRIERSAKAWYGALQSDIMPGGWNDDESRNN